MIRRIATAAALVGLVAVSGGSAAAAPAPSCVSREAHYQALVAAPYIGARAAKAEGIEKAALEASFYGLVSVSRLPLCSASI